MDSTVFFIILLATIMHAIWNAMVKHHKDKAVAVSAIVFGHVPLAVVSIFIFPLPGKETIPYIILSAIIHQRYQWYMLNSYKVGDYTNVYPIFRGSGPLFATIISLILLNETLKISSIFSIFLICFGIMFIGLRGIKSNKNSQIIKYSLLTGSFIGMYSLIDGYGARISNSAISYMSFSFILSAIMFPFLLKLQNQKNIIDRVKKNGKLVFWIGGSLSFIIYIIVVWAFTKAPIPLVAALRETSIFFSIFIGYFFLKEKITPTKIISVILIVVGVLGLKLLSF